MPILDNFQLAFTYSTKYNSTDLKEALKTAFVRVRISMILPEEYRAFRSSSCSDTSDHGNPLCV